MKAEVFLLIIAVALALAVIWLGWRYFAMRRHVRQYSNSLHKIVSGGESLESLPEDVPALEEISNEVKSLVLALQESVSAAESERGRLAAVLDRMTDGVLIAGPAGEVQFANPAVERLFEVTHPEGRTVAEVLRHHQLVEAWQLSRATGQAQEESIEVPARRRFLALVVLPDRQTGGSLLLVQDLTRLRRLETVRRDFISNVSHELRTPLASLKALTETLREGALEEPQAARRFLGRIETEVDTLTQMAGELLELSRIESGQVPLELKAVPAAALLLSAAERMRTQAERAGLLLRIGSFQDIPEVLADAPRLEQVLVNLIHNSIKFTPAGGEVVLSAQGEDTTVRFSVHDNGMGIPEDDLERIFERFYKADRARSGGGTGLGLSIARHLVEAHGGRVWAESREGSGSTFFFTIPRAK